MNSKAILFAVFLIISSCGQLLADTFGSGANTFDIEFVTIGNPGNPPDTTGTPNPAGSVPYEYRIGKYEISQQMVRKANTLGGLGLTFYNNTPNKPAADLGWNEIARFVNWLNTNTGNPPAYKFAHQPGEPSYFPVDNCQFWTASDPGYKANNPLRNKLAKYFLPTDNEWYKAAYYDPVAGVYYDYPAGSNTPPDGIDFAGDTQFDAVFQDGGVLSAPNDITNVGILSPYGTAGQGGNVFEFEETPYNILFFRPWDDRGMRGGNYLSSGLNLSSLSRYPVGIALPSSVTGFRVASVAVPESSSALLVAVSVWLTMATCNRRRSKMPMAIRSL